MYEEANGNAWYDFLEIDDNDTLQAEITTHLDESGAVLGEFLTMVDYLHKSGQL